MRDEGPYCSKAHTDTTRHYQGCICDALSRIPSAAPSDDDSSESAPTTLDQSEKPPIDLRDLKGPCALENDDGDDRMSNDESTESKQRRRIHQSAKRVAESGSFSLRELLRGLLPLLARDQGLYLALLVRDVMCGNLQLSMGEFQEYVRTVLSDDGVATLCQFTSVVGELQSRRRARPSNRAVHHTTNVRVTPGNLRQRRCQAWAPY